MKHRYSDECICDICADAWNRALFAAVDRDEKKKLCNRRKMKKERKRGIVDLPSGRKIIVKK